MPVYRYKRTGLDIAEVKKQVPPADASSVSAGNIGPTQVWDITAPTTSKDDLDDFMAAKGWTFDSTDPSDTPAEQSAGDQDHGELSGLGDDDHTQYLNNTRGDVRYYQKTDWSNKAQLDLVSDGDHDVRSDNPHSVTAAQAGAAVVTSTAPVNVTKATAAVGTSGEAARQDHKHDITTATAAAQVPGDSAIEGSASSLARSDHKHSLPAYGTGSGTFCQGNDSRLSDARTPTSHATSHQSGGGDAVKLDDLAAPDDNTDLNATTSAHGLLSKLGGGTTNFLRADGTWNAPPGGGQTLYDAIVASSGGDYTSVAAAFAAGANSVLVRSGYYVETSDIVLPSTGAVLDGEGGSVIALTSGARIEVDGSGGTQETAGTISVTTDDATVTGSGTSFTNLSGGDKIRIGSTWLDIDSITSDTSLELSQAWRGDSVSGLSYVAQTMSAGVALRLLNIGGSTNGAVYIRACLGVSIRDCVVREASVAGLQLIDSYGAHLEETFFVSNVGPGAIITSSNEVTIEGSCHFDNNDADGLLINGSSEHVIVSNSSMTNNDGDGVSCEGTASVIEMNQIVCDLNDGKGINTEPTTSDIILNTCVSEDNGDWGVDYDGARNVLNGCLVTGNGAGGVQGGDDGSIVGCQVNDNGGTGINLDSVDNGNVVIGNHVSGNSGTGIVVDDDDNLIQANIVVDNGGNGINIGSGAADNVLVGNQVENNTSTDIVDNGTNTKFSTEAVGLPAQGDVLYHNGTSWVRLAAGTSGEFLKTNGVGSNPAWAAGSALTSTAPVNVTKAANVVGVGTTAARHDHKHDVSTAAPGSTGVATASGEGSATTVARSDHTHQSNTSPSNVTKAAASIGTSGQPARADHKHDVTTATAVAVGTANAEGSSTSLARANHTHQVTGLTIASQAQGDILYRNASAWVRLAAGTSGQVLQTNGSGANPTWVTPSGGGGSYKEYLFQADQMESPNSADWPEADMATLAPSPSGDAVLIRKFDDTDEEGVGFTVHVPSGATNIIFDFLSQAVTAPGTAKVVKLDLYERGYPDNSAVDSWSSGYSLTDISIPANSNFQQDTQTIALSTLGLTANRMFQFELERNVSDAGDTLVGDWGLHSIRVRWC